MACGDLYSYLGFSAHELSLEDQINYKISHEIKVYSYELNGIEDENKREELVNKAKELNIYEEN